MNVMVKRLSLYIFGMLFISLAASLSIQADLGVSPVSSLAYAFALTSGFSVGVMTVVANIIFILIQVILSKQFNVRDAIVQLLLAFLFGFFVDLTLFSLQHLFPAPETLIMRWTYLILSLFVAGIGALGYFTAELPLMPYEKMTYVISDKFHVDLGKAKIASDIINVSIAGLICLLFIKSLGSVGIGTIVSAYAIGKIFGLFLKYFRKGLSEWMYKNKSELYTDSENKATL